MDRRLNKNRIGVAAAALAVGLLICALLAGAASAATRKHVFEPKAVSGSAAVFVVKGVSPKNVVAVHLNTRKRHRTLRRSAVQKALRHGAVRVALHSRHITSPNRHALHASSRHANSSNGGSSGETPRLVISVSPPGPKATPDPGSCSLASSPEGTDPGACWRPFSSASPFNQTLPASPRLMPGSSAIVEKMFQLAGGHGPSELEVFKDGRGGEPTYYSSPNDPVFTIHCTRPWGHCMLEGMQVRIPAGAQTEGEVASVENESQDAHLTVIDPSTEREYDFWQVQSDPIPASGGTLKVSWGGYASLSGTGLDMPTEATAAKWASLEGRIRAEELLAGHISHALFINVKCDSGSWVYPAAKAGAKCSESSNAPPMGARLQLNYTVAEIEAMALPSWKKTVLRAMSEYGMFIGDTGSPSLFSLERETGSQYSSVGRANKWLEVVAAGGFNYWSGEGGVNVGDLAGGINWHRLQVIDPCVSEGTC